MDENFSIRTLPYSNEAEQSVLGCVFVDPQCLITVAEALSPDDFYIPQNKLIFSAMLDLWNRGEAVDSITVTKELGKNLEAIGGYDYLARLAIVTPTTQNLKAYIRIVADKASLRRLISAANTIADLSYDGEDDVSVIMGTAEKCIYDVVQNRNMTGVHHIKDVLISTFDQIEQNALNRGKVNGVPSGFSDLDAVTNGFHKSELIILAARPGVGKTSFAMNIAQYAALHANIPTVVFNLEMSKEQLGTRIIWSESLVPGDKIRTGNLSEKDWPVLANAVGKLSKAPLYIDDTSSITITDIRAKAQKLQLEHGLGLIIIDYLQLMQGSKRSESRQQEISEISRSLKILSKELEVPIIALSQLSRESEKRNDKKPQLSDLRESGAIEQDADIVMFLHADKEQDNSQEQEEQAENHSRIVKCTIAKHRNGECCSIDLMWNPEITRFVSINRRIEG
ncbi:MAG: replicative DNA helicase [Clostridia bacterium]|nr:replicative DNA helicase [Clostridia bacterium]